MLDGVYDIYSKLYLVCYILGFFFSDIHASDSDGRTCLHHAAQSKALIAQNVVSTIISGGPNLGKIHAPKF